MKIELQKETDIYGKEKFWLCIKDAEGFTKDVKAFATKEAAETWIDEMRYKIQEAKTEILNTYDLD